MRGPVRSLAIGLASGLGNCVSMLPAIKALKLMGHRIALCVQTDFDTTPLWRRCAYADEILADPLRLDGHEPMCGQWSPPAWRGKVPSYRQERLVHVHQCEWRSNMRLAASLGWAGEAPDVSDWCRDLDRSKRWDVGIAPGSKGGIWLRKRWPGMANVAACLLESGRSVAVFGLPDDGIESVPGRHIDTREIGSLPDLLAGCRVVVGGDSGVTHLASSLGIPVVMVYTATSETKAEPVCRPNRRIASGVPCRPCVSTPRWANCSDWICREIDPARVAAVVEEML